jgi:hypothetical protein
VTVWGFSIVSNEAPGDHGTRRLDGTKQR